MNTNNIFFKKSSIFPAFAILAFWLTFGRSLMGGLMGWVGFFYLIPISIILVISGIVFSLLFDKDYDQKITSFLIKTGRYIFPAFYISTFIFGFFIPGDNGDAEGRGSVYTAIFGQSLLDVSNLISIIAMFVSAVLFIIVVFSFVRFKYKHSNHFEKIDRLRSKWWFRIFIILVEFLFVISLIFSLFNPGFLLISFTIWIALKTGNFDKDYKKETQVESTVSTVETIHDSVDHISTTENK